MRLSICLCFLLFSLPLACRADLETVAEQSGYTRTGHYQEVEQLCSAYAARWPDKVRCDHFGNTPEGRPMLALIASSHGALTPQAAQDQGLPVLLVQGGIHAGEIDGKDAGFLALRELLQGKAAPGALEHFVLVFVPVFNADGHERFGQWNRPNQVGPQAMGWRTTAQNYNLNRDYTKADAPEMQAMLRYFNAWDPILSVDLHVTDGAKFQPDVSIQVEPAYSGDPAQQKQGLAMRDSIIEKLGHQGAMALPFYPEFRESDDPASGFETSVMSPRYSTGYPVLRNRFSMLVETHSWKNYARRVKVTHDTLVDLFRLTADDGARWQATAAEADARARQLAGTPVDLEYAASEHFRLIDFPGYAYTRTPSAISGALATRYDDTRPQVWHVPLYDDLQLSLTLQAPKAGYLVPAAEAAWVAEKLDLHGIQYQRLDAARTDLATASFRATQVQFAKAPFENHQRATIQGSWKPEQRAVPAGSLYVPIDQSKARLVMALLEPQATDSLAAWGFFNFAFERKEYMEAYVAEDVARDMLARDPALATEFAQRLASDEAFRSSPRARLDFFYQRHPSYDERLNLYPVLRVDTAPQARTAAPAEPGRLRAAL